MCNLFFSLITGIGSGIIVSVLSYAFYRIWKDIIKPWYVRTIYKGIDVSGTWRGGFGDPNFEEIKTVFDIKQDAFDLSGVFFAETIRKNNFSENYSNQYKFLGQIKNNMIIINYEAISNKRTGVGTLMFQSSEGGNILSGHVIHSEDIKDIWSVKTFKLKRNQITCSQ